MCHTFASSVQEMYIQGTSVPKGWRRKCVGSHSSRTIDRIHVLWHGVADITTKHTYKSKTCAWAPWWISFPLMCLFNAPKKLLNHNIHRDIKLEFVMLEYHVLRKKLPNLGRFPNWRQLCRPYIESHCNTMFNCCIYRPGQSQELCYKHFCY